MKNIDRVVKPADWSLGHMMGYGKDDLWRVWRNLERKEDELRWGGGFPGQGRQYDSMGRPASSSSYVNAGWLGEQLGRVGRVRRALRDSGPMAQALITQTLTGINITTVVGILVSACTDFALYYGGSVVTGGVIGGVGGAFAGGVGAIPGAGAGMVAGSYVGTWILALVGLKSLVEGIAHAIPEALKCYAKGFTEAWGPVRQDSHHGLERGWGASGNLQSATLNLANGHLILASAILTAMVAYLTRGKGDRGALLKEIGQSPRLGPKVAKWLEENEEQLKRHPALQSRSSSGAGAKPPSPPKPPQRLQEQAPRKPGGVPKFPVPCFNTKGLPQGSVPEFDRQLAGQETGINNMTVAEYLAGRDAFDNKQSVRNPNIARNARADYEQKMIRALLDDLLEEGLTPQQAAEKATETAAEKMKTLAGLHNPDMVAGGKDVISDFGSRNINSRIGAQWRKGLRLTKLDEWAKAVPEAAQSVTKMHVSLKRC